MVIGLANVRADTVLFHEQTDYWTGTRFVDVRQSLDMVYEIPNYLGYNDTMATAIGYGMTGQTLELGDNSMNMEPTGYLTNVMALETPGIGTYTVTASDGMLRFQFIYDDGAYQYEFGYFEMNAGLNQIVARIGDGIDDDAERVAFGQLALNPAGGTYDTITVGAHIVQTVFSDANTPDGRADFVTDEPLGANPVQAATFSQTTGSVIAFYIIRNNTRANFLANPSSFSLAGNSTTAWPLFSISAVNPGARDQLFAFIGNAVESATSTVISGTTVWTATNSMVDSTALFTWEDITRDTANPANMSDQDFNDLHFTVTGIEESPIPEAGTFAVGAAILGALGFAGLRKRLKSKKSVASQF
jgi:hypothetical protein